MNELGGGYLWSFMGSGVFGIKEADLVSSQGHSSPGPGLFFTHIMGLNRTIVLLLQKGIYAVIGNAKRILYKPPVKVSSPHEPLESSLIEQRTILRPPLERPHDEDVHRNVVDSAEPDRL